MSHYTQSAVYALARDQFLQAFEYMRKSIEDYKEKQGGDAAMPENVRRIYHSRRQQLATLANYYDATEQRLQEKEAEIADLINQVRAMQHENHSIRARLGETSTEQETRIHPRQWLKMMLLVGNTDPIPIGSILAPKEGRRQAQTEYAKRSQPHLFTPYSTENVATQYITTTTTANAASADATGCGACTRSGEICAQRQTERG